MGIVCATSANRHILHKDNGNEINSNPFYLPGILPGEKVILNIDTIIINSQSIEIDEKIEIIRKWNDSWTGYGFEKPNNTTISHAKDLLKTLLESITSKGDIWLSPIVSTHGDGDVLVMWQKQNRELHLKIYERDVHYFKIWGININDEMESDLLKKDQFPELWEWLIND
ncbi:MAG: hypothetical protein OXU51_11375 [Candidatus Poribacteria bacterium]|nr:hypothetical protein [Candidatus Poribacteria bacterium]